MSNHCLVKTTRHPAEMILRCLRDSFFCKSKQQKPWLDILKKTSHKYLQDTAKTTYETVFKITKRQLFYNSNQCLSRPLFWQHIRTFANCLENISRCLAINFFDIQGSQGWFCLTIAIFSGFLFRFLFTDKILRHNFPLFDY